jgi:ribosomal protein L11 methyltransferase
MTAERYHCLDIAFAVEQRDLITRLLWELDSIGFEELDEEDRRRVLAYFEPDVNIEQVCSRLRSAISSSGTDVSIEAHAIAYDSARWIEEYNLTFTGFEVNSTFWIHPPWEERSDDHPVNILIEPGHGFGTGTHESTQLALVAMVDIVPDVESVADVGTGSGILTAAAAKLGPGLRIVAFDADPLAVEAASKTFRQNNVEGVVLFAGEIESLAGRFDLILANLTSAILSSLADDLIRRTGKYLIASGFTLDEADRVKEDLEKGNFLRCSEQWTKNGWACWLLRKCEES